MARLRAYADLLLRWQARINLVGPATLPGLWFRHFLDSAQLAPLARGQVLVDLGSGAGFPGLVLALLRDGQQTHLIESDKRKAAFLTEATRVTGLVGRVVVHATRAENLPPSRRPRADTVTARALAPLPQLIGLATEFLAPAGLLLVPKGAEAEAELTRAQRSWKMRVTRHRSRTDPAATLLALEDLSRGSSPTD